MSDMVYRYDFSLPVSTDCAVTWSKLLQRWQSGDLDARHGALRAGAMTVCGLLEEDVQVLDFECSLAGGQNIVRVRSAPGCNSMNGVLSFVLFVRISPYICAAEAPRRMEIPASWSNGKETGACVYTVADSQPFITLDGEAWT